MTGPPSLGIDTESQLLTVAQANRASHRLLVTWLQSHDTTFSGGAETHAGNDRLSGHEDGSSQAPTPTTAISETHQAQARHETHSDHCLYFHYITRRSL